MNSVAFEVGQKKISVETGALAKQANGSVLVRCEETVVLVSVCAEESAKNDASFFPLTVDYREKNYAAGRIPGGFFKREARPTDTEVLVMRLTDRSLRPLFPDTYLNEVQVMAQVLSFDKMNLPDVLAVIGTAFAVAISDVPVEELFAAVRVSYVNGKFVLNPSVEELNNSTADIMVAGTSDSITMVEGSSSALSEKDLLDALKFAHKAIVLIIEAQKKLKETSAKPKQSILASEDNILDSKLYNRVEELFFPHIEEAFGTSSKKKFSTCLKNGQKAVVQAITEDPQGLDLESVRFDTLFAKITKKKMRELVFQKRKRVDGRDFDEIRSISSEVSLLPRVHGSALFTRGETQVLSAVTLGASSDEQMIDGLSGITKKKFFLHYNFPPFSVGECKQIRSVSRREIGHGFLAEKALKIVNASHEDFPYTIRIVAEVLESNGSSSMASVCSGSMALMDAGVPIKSPVSGIAMGLMKSGDDVLVLSDISGTEDFLGDMDFKVAGTENGLTSFQMDIKIKGISFDILDKALSQAKEGRLFILNKMKESISESRKDLSPHAPKIVSFSIPLSKIKDVIGPGGKTIKGIIKKTSVDINVEDSGEILISSPNQQSLDEAYSLIQKLTQDPKIGDVYDARVVKIMDFGAFVEFLPGKEGLVHISQISTERIRSVRDCLSEGDTVKAKLIDIDKMGRKSLSMKAVNKV